MASWSWTQPRRVVAAVTAALAVAVPAVLAAVGVRLWWVLGLGVAVAAVGGVFAPVLGDSYRRSRDRLEDSDYALARDSVFRRVLEITDPVLDLGVHPSRLVDHRIAVAGHADGGDRVPAYVPRDIHDRLVELLAVGGFIVLVGESTAGKSRAAYEAMRAVLPDHILIAPGGRSVLSDAVDRAAQLPRCVLWLDDLERFLGPDGLTRSNVARLIGQSGHHRVVLATIRSVAMARYTDITHPDASEATEARQVLEQATQVRLQRRLTPTEYERALTRTWDQRIADALDHAAEYGLAEYLSAGPELLNAWENAWEAGHPRAAALIAAAVDCRRVGMVRPLPRTLLESLHEQYLVRRGGDRLGPEPLDAAWAWATHLRGATAAILRPCTGPDSRTTAVEVFDYLVDATEQAAVGNRVPEQTLTEVLAESDATEADQIGTVAHAHGHYELAVEAFERAQQLNDAVLGPDHPETLTNRSNRVVMLRDLGRSEEAVAEAGTVLQIRTRTLGPDHPQTLVSRSILASTLRRRGDHEQAEVEGRAALVALSRVLGPDAPSTLAARNNLAIMLHSLNRYEEAEAECRAAFEVRRQVFGPDHIETLASQDTLGWILNFLGRYEEAEAELRGALEGYLRNLGAEHRLTITCRHVLAYALWKLGQLEEAETQSRTALRGRTRALGPDHPDTLLIRHDLADILRDQGRHDEADRVG
ncbi:tetratricopeptide repeat protein [Streptomyces canus]|uniref:tetratricopeptide repeat protein n=1 Tax=Streptomyces canus TaxID=58343 RepID=UPI0036CFB0DD